MFAGLAPHKAAFSHGCAYLPDAEPHEFSRADGAITFWYYLAVLRK
jgi:hypothetical protein